MIRPVLTLAAATALSACIVVTGEVRSAESEDPAGHDNPEAESYLVSEDAAADLDAVLERASRSEKRVLLVMGANWCHDSRALAGWLNTDRFAKMIDEKYELMFVNVGMPQSGDGHNLAIAQRFGVNELPGTPNVLVITSNGDLVNGETATTWRNAASRSEDEIYDELVTLSAEAI